MFEKFKPMLAYTVKDTSKIEYPVLGSIKLDGIRLILKDGQTLTRSLKPLPNDFIREYLSDPSLSGLDGELIVGPSNADDVYRATSSAVMSKKGQPDFTFRVFDMLPLTPDEPYIKRYERLRALPDTPRIFILDQVYLRNEEELLEYEEEALKAGYEGLMVRHPYGAYKFGRSTAKSAEIGKIKRWEDSEAIIVGFECLYKNGNEATINELGYTERSSHNANLIPQDTLGKLICKDIHTGIEVVVGSGFTAAQRKEMWEGQDNLVGKIIKYKHFPIGAKDKSRFPIFQGLRSELDIVTEY